MSCEEYREIASARLDGEATSEEIDALQRHLATCADCSRWVASVTSDRERLLDWPEERPRQRFEPTVRRRAWQGWAAAAAVLIAALGIGFVAGRASAPGPSGEAMEARHEVEVHTASRRAVFVEHRRTVYPARREVHSDAVLHPYSE